MATKIILKDINDLQQKFLELTHISIKLRRAQIYEQSCNLQPAREARKYWEKRMDDFIQNLNVQDMHMHKAQINLKIENKGA